MITSIQTIPNPIQTNPTILRIMDTTLVGIKILALCQIPVLIWDGIQTLDGIWVSDAVLFTILFMILSIILTGVQGIIPWQEDLECQDLDTTLGVGMDTIKAFTTEFYSHPTLAIRVLTLEE